LEKYTVQKILKAENGRIGKDKESMTEKRNQRELLWFQTGVALNFITAAPHSGVFSPQDNIKRYYVNNCNAYIVGTCMQEREKTEKERECKLCMLRCSSVILI
jgi:hypothetical protein